jgi:O-antigen/teichoic acid export membrane protein
MRTKKSIVNMIAATVAQVFIVLLGLVSRRIFIQTLSIEYLGCNGVFSNVLEILTLVGCGASAVSYLMIKAVASEEKEKIQQTFALVHLYQWCTCGLLVLLGCATGLFLPTLLMNTTSFSWNFLQAVYLLFLVDLCLSMWSGLGGTPGFYDCIIKASQQQAVCSLIECCAKLSIVLMQILVLYYTHNYFAYLLLGIGTKLIYIVVTRSYCYKHFPYLKEKVRLPKSFIRETKLFAEIRSNLAITISTIVFLGTDNLVITGFLGITITGLYSNYSLFYNQLQGLVSKFLSGMSASVGNYVQQVENPKEKHLMYYRIQTICGAIALFCAVCYWTLCEPMIELCFGRELLLDRATLAMQSILLFFAIYSQAGSMFRHAVGQYWLDQNYNIVAAVVNLGLSLLLVQYIGLPGILLGTLAGVIIQIAGYLKVIGLRSVPGEKASVWWSYAGLWGTALAVGMLLSYLLTGAFPYTWGYAILSGFIGVGIVALCGAALLAISQNVKETFRYALRLVERMLKKD